MTGRLFSPFDDRGVSESLGYILVFAIVLTGIGGIVLFGVTMLNNAKDQNNFQNVQQGLTVVQSDMKRVALEKAPVITSKLRIEGGSLSTGFTGPSMSVDFNGNHYHSVMGNITYCSSAGLKTLSIEDGGLWEFDGTPESDLCDQPPRIYSSPSDGTIVINVIRLTGNDSSIATPGTVNVIMDYVGNHVYTYTAPVPSDVTISVDTAYPDAWARILQDAIDGFPVTPISVTDSSTQVTISGVTQVVISEHTIQVEPFAATS